MKPHLYIYKISIGAGSLVCAMRNPKVNQLSPCLQGPWNETWWPLGMSTLWGYYFLVHTMPWYKFEWSMSFYLFFYVVCYCITWITRPKVDFQSPVRQNAFLATSHPPNPHLDEKTKSGGLSLLREAGEQEKQQEEFIRLSDWSLLFLLYSYHTITFLIWPRGVWSILPCPLTLDLALSLALTNELLVDMIWAEVWNVLAQLGLPFVFLSLIIRIKSSR